MCAVKHTHHESVTERIAFAKANNLSAENLSKRYQLGVIGAGTFSGDLERWWAKQRGKPDPYLKIGEVDHGNRQGEYIGT